MSFFGGIGNFLGGVVRQVNPFDHGATYSNPHPQQRPQPQARVNVQHLANALQVHASNSPVLQQPVFHPAPPPLPVHVAAPQILHMGNQTIQQSPQARSGVAPPAQHQNGVINALKQDAGSVLSPAIHGIAALNPVSMAYHAAQAGSALATGNKVALKHAAQPYVNLGKDVKNLAQGTAAQAYQLGESLNPVGGDVYNRVHNPTGFQKVILGSNPIPSMQNQYKQQKQTNGAGFANTQAGVTALIDAMGTYGAGKGSVQLAKNAKPLNDVGGVGKDVNRSPAPIEKSPSLPVKGNKALQQAQQGSVPDQATLGKAINNYVKQYGTKGQAYDNMTKAYEDNFGQAHPSTNEFIPQASSEGKIVSKTSLENRLNRMGGTGQDTLQAIRNKETTEAMHTQAFKDQAKPFFDLKPKDQSTAIKVQKGETTTTNPSVQAGADSLRTMFKNVHGTATSSGMEVHNLGDNYFPVSYPKGWFNKPKNFNAAVQDLVRTGKAPDLATAINKVNQFKIEHSLKPNEFGNFKERLTNLPGGIENADTVANYIKGSSRAIAEAQHFGPNHEVLNGLVAKAVNNGEDAGAIRNIVSSYLHPKRSSNKVLGGYQRALRVIQLPRAAISHLPQSFANTGADVGYTRYFKSLEKSIFKDPETERLIKKAGINSEDFGKSSNLSDKATAPGLGKALSFQRNLSARAGMAMAEGLAKKGKIANLQKMGIDGEFKTNPDGSVNLTDYQKIQAAHFQANRAMGSHSVLQSPAWIDTSGGKLVGQYRKMYTFKQAERIGNWMTEAKNGNVAPLARYLAVGVPVSGLAVAGIKGQVKNPGTNPLKKPGQFAENAINSSGLLSAGYGLPESAFNALTHNYGNDSAWSNAGSAVAPGVGFGIQTGQNIAKASHGKTTALKREAFNMIPVGGTALANKFAPSQAVQPGVKYAVNSPQAAIQAKDLIKQAYAKPPKSGSTKGLPDGRAIYVSQDGKVHVSENINNAKLDVAKDKFRHSSSNIQQVGDTVLTKGAGGRIDSTPKIKYDYSMNSAELTNAKDNGDLKAYVSTAQAQLQNIAQQISDPNTSPLDQIKLQNESLSLQKNLAKYNSYGGFTKGGGSGTRTASGGTTKVATLKVKAPPKPRALKIGRLPKASSAKQLKFNTTKTAIAKTRKIRVNLG